MKIRLAASPVPSIVKTADAPRVTPGGQVPTADSLVASVDAIARRLGTT